MIFVLETAYCRYVRGFNVFLYRSNVFDAECVKYRYAFIIRSDAFLYCTLIPSSACAMKIVWENREKDGKESK